MGISHSGVPMGGVERGSRAGGGCGISMGGELPVRGAREEADERARRRARGEPEQAGRRLAVGQGALPEARPDRERAPGEPREPREFSPARSRAVGAERPEVAVGRAAKRRAAESSPELGGVEARAARRFGAFVRRSRRHGPRLRRFHAWLQPLAGGGDSTPEERVFRRATSAKEGLSATRPWMNGGNNAHLSGRGRSPLPGSPWPV